MSDLMSEWRKTLQHIVECNSPTNDCAKAWAKAALEMRDAPPHDPSPWVVLFMLLWAGAMAGSFLWILFSVMGAVA